MAADDSFKRRHSRCQLQRRLRGTPSDGTNAKLAGNEKRSSDLMNAARIQGAFPPEENMLALYRDRMEILKAAVQDAQSRLSPEGWQVLLKFMPRASAVGIMVQPQAPPK